jgi:hypothetical protein
LPTLSLPSAPKFRSSTFRLVSPTQLFRSPLNGVTQTVALDGDRWEASFELPPMLRAQAALWQSFFAKLRGRAGRFYAYDPDARAPRGTIAGTPLVNGASQTGSTLNIDGVTNGTTLLEGDYIAFDTSVGRELKMVTADVTASGGAMAVAISPPIRTSPANNETIITASPTCVMMLADDAMEWAADHMSVYGISFTGVEAVVG